MNAKRDHLPQVQDLPGETIAQFKAIGVDEEGKTLYQRVGSEDSAIDLPVKKVNKTPPLVSSGTKDYEIAPSLRELRHQQAKKEYAELGKLMDNEFVLTVIDRHPLGIFLLWAVDIVLISVITIVWILFLVSGGVNTMSLVTSDQSDAALIMIIVIIDILLVIAGWIGVGIYKANRLFITSERVIQFVARGPFDRKQQAIDLSGIEDVSSSQKGIFATLFNFGTIRMSTIGDETTYTLTFIENPNAVADRINVILQAVKNDRPVPIKLDN